MPFQDFYSNIINIYNEFIIGSTCIVTLAINLLDSNPNSNDVAGWILISLILISLISTWIQTIPSAVKELYNMLMEIFNKSDSIYPVNTIDKTQTNLVEFIKNNQEGINTPRFHETIKNDLNTK